MPRLRVALDVPADVVRHNGDSSFLHELTRIDNSLVAFEPGSRARGYEVKRLMVGGLDRLAQVLPIGQLRLLALAAARSIRITRLVHADVTLSHLSCPRRPRGTIVIWSSQGISSPGYYRTANRRVTIDDVAGLYDKLANRADRLLVWDEAGADRLKARCPGLADKVFVIPPPIVDRYVPEPSPPSPLRLLFAGSDWRRKGLVDLLSAFAAVTKLDPSATLDVVTASTAPGAGQAGVRFHGPCSRERVLELLRQCNVLVLPSLAETYGLIVVEALMMSRACVVSDADPLPEIAADGGLVFRAGDADDLGKQLLRLVAEPSLVAALQRRARERYLERHHPDVFLASFLRCLG